MATRAPKRAWPFSFLPTTAPRLTCSSSDSPSAAIERICTGRNVSNLTLTQLQAINGTLSVTSQGYQYSVFINLADVTSFTAAATAIQAALNENLPVAAVTKRRYDNSGVGVLHRIDQRAAFGRDLDRVGRAYEIGALDFRGRRSRPERKSTSQFTGTPGGVGLYSLYVPAGHIASEAITGGMAC